MNSLTKLCASATKAAVLLVAIVASMTSSTEAAGINYTTTIQPIYNSLCISCHSTVGPDAGLNLQTNSYANTVNKASGKFGSFRIRPNFATTALSSIYTVVVSQGTGARHKGGSWVATAAQKTSLTDWINQGALPNLNPPTITSLSTISGGTAGGGSVTITGTGFGGTGAFAPVVTFGGTPATNVVVTTASFTTLTCTIPSHEAGAVDVIVTTTAGGVSAAKVGGYTYTSGAPAKLAFSVQPSSVVAGGTLAPAVKVQVQDSAGNLTPSTASITLALGANPGSSVLSGTTTTTAVADVATFTDLGLNRAGNGYTLTASASGLTGATSNAFNVTGTAPVIISPTASAVATSTATLGGETTSDGGATITARGVVLAPTSVNSNPNIGGAGVTNVAAASGGVGVFTVNATALLPGTSYTFAAYATNEVTTSYTLTGSFTTLSNNANLANLIPSTGTLAPAFNSATTDYTFTVPYTTSSLTITPSTASSLASVTVNGVGVTSGALSNSISLAVGSNVLTTSVTAQDGTIKDYVVTVTRTAASTNANLASLTTSTGTMAPVFDAAVTSYALTVAYAMDSISIVPTVADGFSTLQVNGSPAVSGAVAGPFSLVEGINTITTLVTAQDGSSKPYTLAVTREAESTSATLTGLVPSSGALAPAFHFATTSYTLNVTLETTSVTFTPTLTAGIASVQVNGLAVANNTISSPVSLNVGSNLVGIVVTSQDASKTLTYEVTVHRLPSANANLASLTPAVGTLSPVFDPAITSYDLEVPNATTTISLTPATANEFASLTFNGTALASGVASSPLTLLEGRNAVTIIVTAQDGTLKTYNVNVRRGYKGLPRIVTQPASQTVSLGASVTLNVVVVGSETLKYQWRKNAVSILNATSSSYTIPPAVATSAGAYSVVVSNALGSVISDAATLAVAKAGVVGFPSITTQPVSALVPLGQTASFSTAAVGAPTLGYQWRKNGLAIALATATSYTTPATALTSAGVYSVLVKNLQGSVVSTGARLGVVSTVASTKLAKAGTIVTITASAAGEGLIYHWKKDGVEINDSTVGTHIVTGTSAASLVIKGSITGDTGVYTCLVRMADKTLESGVTTLKVYDKAPIIQLATNDALPPAIVSGTYHDGTGHEYVVPVDPSSDRSVVTFSATLPSGLKINPTTGAITGKPLVASPVTGPFKVTITATNAVNKHTVVVLLTVSPLPSPVVGTFNGLIDRDVSLTSGLSLNATKTVSFGGSLYVATTATGVFSGRVVLGAVTYSFVTKVLDTSIGGHPIAHVVIPRGTATPLMLDFTINKDTGELAGTITDSVAPTVNVRAWRHTAPAATMLGAYTAVIDFTPGQVPDPTGNLAYPHGYGFGTLTVAAASASWSGKLSDGTAVTFATTIGSTGQIPMHMMLYTNTGSVHGWMQITADHPTTPTNGGLPLLDGTIDWVKAAQLPTSTNHNYKAGIPLHSLTVAGGKYVKVVPTVLGLVDGGVGTTNARLTFSDGGLTGPAPIIGAMMAGDLNATTFRITNLNTLVMPVGAVANPAALTFALNAATGALSGTFTLAKDPDPTDHVLPIALLSRKVAFAGVIVPRVSINKGVGYFLMPKLPEDGPPKTTLLTSDILSGSVELGPK